MQMIRLFTEFLRNNLPFAYTKLGDGELLCMNGHQGTNSDGHHYTADLAEELRKAFTILFSRDDCYIGKWTEPWCELIDNYPPPRHWVEFNLLNPNDHPTPEILEFYAALKHLGKNKVYIGPEVNAPVAKMLEAEHLVIPLINCWQVQRETEKQLAEMQPEVLITTCGMAAKPLIADAIQRGITCVDVGTFLDPVAGRQTRARQMSPDDARKFFKELL
jgi:hypothetical protein